eukprot:3627031-Pyramimonas_sp.AAC.1
MDGACPHRKWRHTPSHARRFLDQRESYMLDKDGVLTRVVAAELFADHMLKAAKLAARFFRQPSGGSAAQGRVCDILHNMTSMCRIGRT